MKIKVFGREPALALGVLSAALGVAVTMGASLTAAQAALIVGAISAVGGALMAVTTRPVQPAAFTGAVAALAALFTGFGLEVSAELVAGVSGLTIAVLSFFVRSQVQPVEDGERASQ